MPLFGGPVSPYDEIVEKVTAETLTSENWVFMMEICDRVNSDGAKGAKQCLLSIKKRLNHRDPHVVLFALSLLDCLWNNSGSVFRREVSSNEFISELTYRATNSNRIVADKTRELIKKWSENECKRDPSLALIESLYKDLLDEGYTFDSPDKEKMSKQVKYSNDPNVVSTEEEEADIAKAIALSLNDQKRYSPAPVVKEEPKKTDTIIQQVRALYDFEAVESNEISFSTGDLVNVFENSDQNWWRGQLARGGKAGLFPSSFVTSDLTVPDDTASIVETVRNEPVTQKPVVQIDESVMKRCIELLEQCDPSGETPDDPELGYYEQMSMAQAPLIDQKLAQIDKMHNALAQIDVAIRDVLATYDNAFQQANGHKPQHPTYTPPISAPQQIPSSMPQQMPQNMPHQIPSSVPQQMQPNMPTNYIPQSVAPSSQAQHQVINMPPQGQYHQQQQ